MDKLLEIKIGGGAIHSGWMPLSAYGMIRDLLDAIAEEGTDEEVWRALDPQVEVIGRSSTLLAVHTNFAAKLRPQVRTFREKAKRLTLRRQGREFLTRNIATPSARWSYVEVIEAPIKRSKAAPAEKASVLRFDAHYKERFLEKQAEPMHGFDEIYAVVVRAGGAAEPRVTLDFLSGQGGGTYAVRGRDVAKRLGAHLYDTVKLKVEAWWNPRTLELERLVVHDLVDEWKKVHLAEVYREHGNRLPVKLTFDSVEELLAERNEDRSE